MSPQKPHGPRLRDWSQPARRGEAPPPAPEAVTRREAAVEALASLVRGVIYDPNHKPSPDRAERVAAAMRASTRFGPPGMDDDPPPHQSVQQTLADRAEAHRQARLGDTTETDTTQEDEHGRAD